MTLWGQVRGGEGGGGRVNGALWLLPASESGFLLLHQVTKCAAGKKRAEAAHHPSLDANPLTANLGISCK